MIDIGFFYILLLLLFLILLLVTILYSGAHSRIIAPPLMNNFYGISTPTTTITNSWQDLQLVTSGTSSNFNLNSSTVPFEFVPLASDKSRSLGGKLLMYAQSLGTSVWFQLRLQDTGNSKTVADATNFILYPGTSFGLQTLQLIFDADNLENNFEHNFVLQAKSRDTTPIIQGTSILINSAYFTYI